MIGGSANRVRAISVASPARPNGPKSSRPGKSAVTSSASRANVGTARPMLVMLIARKPPRPRCPSQSATGSPTSSAIASAEKLSSSCWNSRSSMPPFPVQFAPSLR
jgi:hypothetical protein